MNAMLVLHPPQPEPVITDPGPSGGQEEPPPEEPPMRSLEDIENERPGQARGQGGGTYQEPERWRRGRRRRQRALEPADLPGPLQLDLRNRAALITPFSPLSAQAGNFADFYPRSASRSRRA
ncbi:MAG: hypothetical protein IPN34_27665 [Planctomycetes bacterium]|nr:hypothetical protein [Planctomycetota bacterium]